MFCVSDNCIEYFFVDRKDEVWLVMMMMTGAMFVLQQSIRQKQLNENGIV
jgi:hypothetical protein